MYILLFQFFILRKNFNFLACGGGGDSPLLAAADAKNDHFFMCF